MTPEFVAAFTEWVEASWFGEHDRAADRLESLVALAPDVVLVGAVGLLARLVDLFAPASPAEVAGALAEHLVVGRADPERAALIAEVVTGAVGTDLRSLLQGRDPVAVTGAALECASFLVQAAANRDGVVPSSILGSL